MDKIFHRTELLLGNKNAEKLENIKVIVFGIGGVGSWCAEGLIRSGVKNLTIVDADNVSITNINRQAMANIETVGQAKTEALKKHLLKINPNANIITKQTIYSSENSSDFQLETYDYIIDAIDSIQHKIHLIQSATKTNAKFFSAMGAALKMSPEKIKVAEFWKVSGCPLAATLRKRLKKFGMPSKKFLCVYSDEIIENKENSNLEIIEENTSFSKAVVNGSLVHITAIFGFTLAGLIIKDIYNENN